MMRLVVMVSGSGSNLQAILDAVQEGSLPAEVVAVVSNRRKAYALERAEKADISTAYAPLKPYRDAGRTREDYDGDLAHLVSTFDPTHVVLAGWMHIFSPAFLDHFTGRVINLHPALPGQFPGADAIGDALAAFEAGKVDHTGCMVHVVTHALDEGPVLGTARVDILPGDTRDTLAARMHGAEHQLLPSVLRQIAAQMTVTGDGSFS